MANLRREKFANDSKRLTSMTEEYTDLRDKQNAEIVNEARQTGYHRNYSIDVSDMTVPDLGQTRRPLSNPDHFLSTSGNEDDFPYFSIPAMEPLLSSSESDDEERLLIPQKSGKSRSVTYLLHISCSLIESLALTFYI